MCILNMCKEIYGAIPKVVGMDVVEMAMWAKVWSITTVSYMCLFYIYARANNLKK